MKQTGIILKNMKLKDGKLEPVIRYRDASHRIAVRKSKRVRVVKKGKAVST